MGEIRLLLIDDSEEDQSQMLSLLNESELERFSVDTASMGKEGFEHLENFDYDCVLLDYRLPDTDGLKFLEKMNARSLNSAPVVFITGQGSEGLAVQAMRMGAADYLVKSYLTPENIVKSIRIGIESRASERRLEETNNLLIEEQRRVLEAKQRELLTLRELAVEKQRFEEFIKQVPSPALILVGSQFAVEYINPAMEELVGRDKVRDATRIPTVEELFGYEIARIAKMVYSAGRNFLANEFEIYRVWSGNEKSLRYFNLDCRPLRNAKDESHIDGVVLVLNDVTALVEARHNVVKSESVARASEERFRKIAEIIPSMMWVTSADGKAEYFNSAWSRYVSGDSRQSEVESWQQYVHPEDVGKVQRNLFKESEIKTSFEVVFRLKHHQSKEYRFNLARGMPSRRDDGQIDKWYISTVDIHDERLLTQSLRDSEQRLTLATSSSRVGIWEFDLKNKKIWRNKEFDAAFGYAESRSDWTLELILSHILDEDRRRVQEAFTAGVVEHLPLDCEFRVLWPSQSLHWLQMNAAVDVASDGRLKMAGTVIDITDRKFREQDLRDARNIAVAASETKTAFLANMSHEIRTPLNAIIGFTDLIANPETSAERRQQFAATVQRNGRALMQIIDDILDLSKIEADKLETVVENIPLKQIVDDVDSLFGTIARQKSLNFEIVQKIDPGLTLASDSIRLKQILFNALSNAIKFTSEGGVRLTIAKTEPPSPDGDWISFAIEDTGIGISDLDQARLFQPFTQADGSMTRKFGGTGLGLMLARRLAKLLNGSFFLVRSSVGVGSVFELRLPLSNGKSVEVMDAGPKIPTNSTTENIKGAQILIVDDSPDSRHLLKYVLKMAGAEVSEESQAKLAVSRLTQNKYDLVITDIQMPEMDGYALTKAIRAMGVETPILGLSAHVFREDREKCLSAGMSEHLGKPIKRDELYRTVSYLLNGQS